jgi:hypothetical protein
MDRKLSTILADFQYVAGNEFGLHRLLTNMKVEVTQNIDLGDPEITIYGTWKIPRYELMRQKHPENVIINVLDLKEVYKDVQASPAVQQQIKPLKERIKELEAEIAHLKQFQQYYKVKRSLNGHSPEIEK